MTDITIKQSEIIDALLKVNRQFRDDDNIEFEVFVKVSKAIQLIASELGIAFKYNKKAIETPITINK